MFLIKITVGVLCVYFCSKISANKANLLKERYLFWDSAVELCNLFLQELSYKKRPLKSTLSKNFISNDFNKVIENYLLEKEVVYPNYVSDIEIEKLNSFLSTLGKSDCETQKIAINSYKTDFENVTIQKRIEFKKAYSIILKVGFLLGVMLFIMVI